MPPVIKNNITVILAFALPILLIIGIAVTVYWPSLFLSTEYDFIYATCSNDRQWQYPPYSCLSHLDSFKVENGKLTVAEVPLPAGPPAGLFWHNSQKNEGREITLTEAQTLKLNGLITSPDGVSVENGYHRRTEFFPFFDGGGSRYDYYLVKGTKRQKLNLLGDEQYYYYNRDNFKFIGWIIK